MFRCMLHLLAYNSAHFLSLGPVLLLKVATMKIYSSTLDHMFTSSAMIPSCDPHDQPGGIELIEQLTKNAHLIQEMVLDEILKRNSETEYLHYFMKGEREKDLFREQVPIVDYDKVKPYIVRIANGENSNIISAKPIVELLTRYFLIN